MNWKLASTAIIWAGKKGIKHLNDNRALVPVTKKNNNRPLIISIISIIVMLSCFTCAGVLHQQRMAYYQRVVAELSAENAELTAWIEQLSGEVEEAKEVYATVDQLTVDLLDQGAVLAKKFHTKARISFYHPPSGGINADEYPELTATI